MREGLVELRGLLEEGGLVLDEVLVGSDGLGLLPLDDQAAADGGGSAHEEHDAGGAASGREARPGEGGGDLEGRPRAPRGPLVDGRLEGVHVEVLEKIGENKLALGEGEEEAPVARLLLRGRPALAPLPLLVPRPAAVQAELVRDLARVALLAALKDPALGALGEPNLVDLDVGAVGDEADEGVLGEEAEGLEEGALAGVELVLADARVDDEDVRRWLRPPRLRDGVVDRAVVREELRGEVGLRDRVVVRRELVPRVAEGAHPELSREVHAGEGVEDGAAAPAWHGLVGHDLFFH